MWHGLAASKDSLMKNQSFAAVVLAAGRGTRMESAWPKVLHPLAGRPMISHLLETIDAMAPERCVVVIGKGDDAVADAVAPHDVVVQDPPLGTGHAVGAALDALEGFEGTVLVLFGDSPLIRPATLARMLEARRAEPAPAVVVLGFCPPEPGNYARLILDQDGNLEAIIEARDAAPQQLALSLCNSGFMAVDGALLPNLVRRLGDDNAKGEFYLFDLVGLARADGARCAMVEGDGAELMGVDTRGDLAQAEAIVQDDLRARAMDGGATLADPSSVHFSFDTRVGRDVSIEPHVVFGPGVEIGDGAHIRAFSHLEGARLAPGASIGPFARLRPGAEIARDARIGNFVEVKNATVEAGAKVNHLAYVGDARVGAGANVGAGTITCNYDGRTKSRTDIGAGAFIGSNTALVAPVKVGAGAVVGAGSVITEDVEAHALALTRAPLKEIEGWAKAGRRQKSGKKS